MTGTLDIPEQREPEVVTLANELRAAFQGGNDDAMMGVLIDKNLRGQLVALLNNATPRMLTFSAPYIADLAKRLGYLANEYPHGN